MLFKRRQLPEYLYKFVSSRTAALILGGRAVSFTAFNALNDPFECLTIFMDPDPPSHWAATAAYTSVKEGSEVLPEEIHKWQMDNWSQRRDLVEKLSAQPETIGVFCLTEDARNLLMWAHYADSHRGSVLRFKSGYLLDWDQVRRIRTAELELVPGPESIRYKKHPPVLSGKSLKNVVRETLLTKSTPWRYEGEWRIFCSIAADSARTVVPLPPNCLDGVFIGARAMHSDSDTIISRVRELNTGTPGQLKVFQATLSKSSYAIEFTHIEI